MKKIAIIVPSNLPVPAVHGGGIEMIIERFVLINELEKKFLFYVFSTYSKEAKKSCKSYKFTRFIWIRRNYLYKLINLLFRITNKLFIKNFNTLDNQLIKFYCKFYNLDHLIIHNNLTQLLYLSQSIPKENIIFHMHVDLFSSKNEYNIMIAQLAGNFVAVSGFIRNHIIVNSRTDPRRVHVIRNLIDIETLERTVDLATKLQIKNNLGIKGNSLVLLFAGRLVEDKGLKSLLLALNKIPIDFNIQLLILGSFGSKFGGKEIHDSFSDEILSLANNLGDKVIFTGFVPNNKMNLYHSIADIVIVPSICNDAAPLVTMEAMTSGIPIITSTQGGIPEYVTEKCGILIDYDENFVENIKQAIIKLYSDEKLRKTLGIKGKELSKDFSPYRFYNDYCQLINRIWNC